MFLLQTCKGFVGRFDQLSPDNHYVEIVSVQILNVSCIFLVPDPNNKITQSTGRLMAGNGSVRNLARVAEKLGEYLMQTKGLDSLLKNVRVHVMLTINFSSLLLTYGQGVSGKVVSVESGKVVFEAQIKQEHANRVGRMHGGFVALLVDTITGAAILTKTTPKPDHPELYSGVSVNLSINYLSAAKVGENIVATANVDRVGRTLAFAGCEVRNKDSGQLLATGQHVKYVA